MNKNQGFTFIELMIVVAIIGVLAAIAIPAYQYHSARAKISEALTQASSAKVVVSEAFMTNGISAVVAGATEYNARAVSEKKTQYVSDMQIGNDGVITVILTTNGNVGLPSDVLGKTLVLTPNIDDAKLTTTVGSIDWACASASANNAAAKSLVADLGTLAAQYAPSECR
ncbi:prepilin-type N-terminal cleavage/methylation domain-containing protein [Acinetobacter sp. ANC 5380]|uniref:Prepilin-type N-terminal cleavage/methylation domain-containing protein n=1 Tax=Acinetobacter terrae TaxID=2731247 RepID=A0A7Y2RGP0_9GAMM|nr:pilin [Acinetobacter terrae]NNH78478.1 prepilin-type N-terminal cleavage/methylation domain-containing protein [Acinetobacter terrae]